MLAKRIDSETCDYSFKENLFRRYTLDLIIHDYTISYFLFEQNELYS